ncbi:MAG: type II secretion system secretin GspD [Chloroflexi bacterium]|nr:type II secretion system secretin GspD [Chloroflexota bacterium]
MQDFSGLATPETVSESEPLVTAQIPLEAAPPDKTDAGTGPESRETMVAVPEFYPGSGNFINPIVGTWQPIKISIEGEVTLNFVDADLREVIRAILGDTLKANYVIDPKVQGLVTLQTSRPIPRSAIIPTLEHILRLNGAALVLAEDLYRIMPADQAARDAGTPQLGFLPVPRGQGFGLQVVPLKFVAAAEMEKILDPIMRPGAVVLVDPARNLLFLSGTRQERATLLEVVQMFDVDWLKGMSFALIPLESTDAKTIVEELGAVFGDRSGTPIAGLVRFVPIERLNSILVITQQRTYLEEARVWIERLDKGGEGDEQRLYVYYVQNGRAVDLADILGQIFSLDSRQATATPELAPGLRPVELRAATQPEPTPRTAAEATLAQGETAAPEQPAPETPATKDIVSAESSRPAPGERGVALAVGKIRIIADEAINALVVLATQRQYRMVEATLRKLDIMPLQVLIEVTIAEVTLNDDLRYGLQWFFKAGGGNELTLSEAAAGNAAQIFPGFSYLFQVGGDVRLVLNALESITDVNVISSPQLMVLNNQTARLQVGDQVPVATQSAVSVGDPDAPIVNQIQFLDTGVILSVTPRVNAGGMVIMEIEQQVSDVVATTTSGIDSPTIRQRQISSIVAVQSGQTIALGGLIRESNTRTNVGIPILKDIPVFGALFGKTSDDTDRTELLVLITPRVVSNQDEARAVTDELRRRLRAVIPLGEKVQ